QPGDVHGEIALLSDRQGNVHVGYLQTGLQASLVRRGYCRDDGVPIAQCAGNETAERVDHNRVTRTEHHIVPMRGEAVSLGDAFEAAADESPASTDRFENRENVSLNARLVHIPVGASPEGLLHDLQ